MYNYFIIFAIRISINPLNQINEQDGYLVQIKSFTT